MAGILVAYVREFNNWSLEYSARTKMALKTSSHNNQTDWAFEQAIHERSRFAHVQFVSRLLVAGLAGLTIGCLLPLLIVGHYTGNDINTWTLLMLISAAGYFANQILSWAEHGIAGCCRRSNPRSMKRPSLRQ